MKRILVGLSCLLSLLACESDEWVPAFQEGPSEVEGWAEMRLCIAAALGVPGDTKASLLKDVESRGSGALVLVFRSTTQQLESYSYFTQDQLASQGQVPLSIRVPLTACDFYILGNLNLIRKSDGRVTNLMESLGTAFPPEETALEAMVYRLDGGDVDGVYRRESFSDVAQCGIPYMLVRKNVQTLSRIEAGLGIPDSDKCRRLFSKVTVRIDHGAFDGSGAHPEFFVNSHLYLRQANARLQPFSEAPQKAQAASDVLAQSDYDPDMSTTNASVTTFSFYVPENMQGTLLPGNTDSRRKTRDYLIASGHAAEEPYLTYVEFAGQLNPAAGGYGGDVTYRFYVGRDNCSNFDLERGREYEISLTFRVGSIFEPDWKVELDNWTDERLFRLTADPAYTTDIGDVNGNRMLAVRKNRPGTLYVYMNPQGSLGATNLLLGKEVCTTNAYIPADLSDCAWYGDLMKAGTDDAAWLAARGITPAWDKTTGRLQLTVTDAALFNAHLGEAPREFTLTLLPGGTLTTRFKVGLYADISVGVADGKSLTDGFYLGQKRTVSVSGFAGTAVKYAAVQEQCGVSPSAVQNANVQWKPGRTGAFPSCAVDGTGRVVLDVNNSAYAAQSYTGPLDVFAFYPNRFQPAHSGWASKDGRIIFFSEDYLNDSVEVPVRIQEPMLKEPEGDDIYVLPIDGNEVVTSGGYYDFDGQNRIREADFDAILLTSLLGVTATASGVLGARFPDSFAMDWRTGDLYVCRTQSGSNRLEEESYNTSSVSSAIARVRLQNPALPDLYPGGDGFSVRVSKMKIRAFSAPRNNSGTIRKTYSGETYSILTHYLDNYGLGGASPSEQLQYDNRIVVWMEYNFVNAAIERVDWERSGDARTYRCYDSDETIGPVIDYTVDTRDTGDGGRIHWVFDETHQQTRTVNGEVVPGPLCIPYGAQTVTGNYENKWDHRSFSTSLTFHLHHSVGLVTFVGVSQTRNAKVYICTWKSAKWLRAIGSQIRPETRQWMLRYLGDNPVGARSNGMYGHRVMTFFSLQVTATVQIPTSNFDVQYIPGHESATRWTQEIAEELNGTTDGIEFCIFPSGPSVSVSDYAQLDADFLPNEFFERNADPPLHYATAPRFTLFVPSGF